jgi:hypothetical protein
MTRGFSPGLVVSVPELPITVLRDPHVRGSTFTVNADTVTLGSALVHAWPSDAHFQAAVAPRWKRRRLVKADVGKTPIAMALLVFDVDAPGHVVTPEWRAEMQARIARLPGSPYAYATRGGFRVLWRLAVAFPIASPQDESSWRRRYHAGCDWLEREHGIVADRTCSDWPRIFRLPHATRDPGGAPEALPTWGDPEAIGVIDLPEAPEEHKYQSPRARSAQGPNAGGATAADAAEMTGDASPGVLERLVGARDHIIGTHELHDGSMALKIECPNAAAHARGRGDGAMLIRGDVGRICCARTACRGIEGEAWITYFTREELIAAGVRRARITRVLPLTWNGAVEWTLALQIEAADNGPALPKYLRATAGSTRWDAIFDSVGLVLPDLADPKDVSEQTAALRGEVITVETDEARVRRILKVRVA